MSFEANISIHKANKELGEIVFEPQEDAFYDAYIEEIGSFCREHQSLDWNIRKILEEKCARLEKKGLVFTEAEKTEIREYNLLPVRLDKDDLEKLYALEKLATLEDDTYVQRVLKDAMDAVKRGLYAYYKNFW